MHGCTPEPPQSSSTQFHPHPHSGRPRLAQADRRVQSTTTRPRVSQSPRPGCEMYASQTAQTPELSTSPMATRWRASFQKGGKLSDIGLAARLPACAAVDYRRCVVQTRAVGRLTIGRSLPSCPTPSSPSIVYTYAQIPAVFLLNRFGLH